MKKIFSIFSLRALIVACGLFVGAHSAFAVYFETIEANKDFYLCNVANDGKYLGVSGTELSLVDGYSAASYWKFSGASGSVRMTSGAKYVKINYAEPSASIFGGLEQEPSAGNNATGTVVLSDAASNITLGGNIDGYTMNISKRYYSGFSRQPARYFYISNTLKSVQTLDDNSRWKLVSKRQIDNTIIIDNETIGLEAVMGGEPSVKSIVVKHSSNINTIVITDGSNTLTIHNPSPSQHMVKVAYQVDDLGAQTITLTDGSKADNKITFSFAARASATLGLTISTTADSGDAIELDKKPMTITGTVVTLDPQYIDWTQDFSALSLTTAPIVLNAVAKTTGGVETKRTITYSLSSTGVVKIVSNKLYVLSEGTTTITAKVAKDATYVGAEKSLTINVSGVPNSSKTITYDNASDPGIYTGTIGGPTDLYEFHKAKRQVNLSKCFNSSKEALFDTLYIFGMTTNTDGEMVSYTGKDAMLYTNVPRVNTPHLEYDEFGNVTATYPCNATTPCYVFAKSGNTYVYTRTFDAVKTRYNWGTKQNGKHIYFNGYCPFAYMGESATENGWMYFQGGDASVDLYLDSCQIQGRIKTKDGIYANQREYILHLKINKTGDGLGDVNISYLTGSSSPFVFTSTTKQEGQSYKPTIHIAGKNHLKGQMGPMISQTMGDVDLTLLQTTLNVGIGGVPLVSSPITVLPSTLEMKTDLVLTDTWKDNTVTNGYLKLNAADVRTAESALAIDLGSENATLTINGGQYHLRNSAADDNYTCNMAIGYKTYERTVEAFNMKIQVQLYGLGNDRIDNVVTINSGTFTMYPNLDANRLGLDYYLDKTNWLDLRLPAGGGKSAINGGTFNGISNVLMCTSVLSTGSNPVNGSDDKLSLIDINAFVNDGVTTFDLSTLEGWYDDPYIATTLANNLSDVKAGNIYGAQSINAYQKSGNNVVSLLLPCEHLGVTPLKETFIEQWVTAVPKFDVQKSIAGTSYSLTMGGPVMASVADDGEDIRYELKNLFFADFDGFGEASFDLAAQGAGLKLNNASSSRGQINNPTSYDIQKSLNMVKAVQADKWYTFTAPFDVKEISVIEKQLDGLSVDDPDISKSEAAARQAQANLAILYGIYTYILPDDIGRTSSKTFDDMLKGQAANKIPLTHYKGDNITSANYYLYKLKNETFNSDVTGVNLDIEWEPVDPSGGEPLLKKGKTYAIQFPWCPMCNDRTKYDYWSNKLILFYGEGPQTIDGTDTHSSYQSIAESLTDGQATFVGNTSFADMSLVANAGYIQNQNDIFEKSNQAKTIRPAEGFMLYKSNTQSMPSSISRTGQMTYDDNAETGVDELPTISDRTSIMILGAMSGFEILSLCDQLVAVYNLQGNIIFQQYMTTGEQVYVATGAGIYVVRGESEAIKVMIE